MVGIPPYIHPILPWVHPAHCCTAGTNTCTGALPGSIALGSTLRFTLGMRRKEASLLPKVCKMEGSSAQSYSALPWRTKIRLDSDRVTLPIFPYG